MSGRVEIITGPERRRSWSDEEKRAAVQRATEAAWRCMLLQSAASSTIYQLAWRSSSMVLFSSIFPPYRSQGDALAAIKRQSELIHFSEQERKRAPGRGHVVGDLPMIRNFGTSEGYISVVVLALYISDPEVGLFYRRPELLWAVCPQLLYWTSRMLMKAHRGEIRHDPIVFALGDRVSLLTAATMALVVIAAAIP